MGYVKSLSLIKRALHSFPALGKKLSPLLPTWLMMDKYLQSLVGGRRGVLAYHTQPIQGLVSASKTELGCRTSKLNCQNWKDVQGVHLETLRPVSLKASDSRAGSSPSH